MLKKTKHLMLKHAQALSAGSDRAQCLNIANLSVSTTIADALANDHSGLGHAQRAASLMVDAGCATECHEHLKHKQNHFGRFFGRFTFEDGSTL